MEQGKYKCKQLKAIRKRIADENGIPLEQKECTYDGPCRGTCPHCEAEVRYIEKALTERVRLGKVATTAGLSLGLVACGGGHLEGEVPMMLTTDSSRVVDTLTDSPRDTQPVGTQPAIPDEICVPEVGKMEITGDVAVLPPTTEDDYEGGIDDYTMDAFVVVDEDPEYPGGMEALYKFLAENIQYPQEAMDNHITGKVYVTFVVEADGSITNPRLLRDIGGGCGQEAIRVVKNMPRWKPGKNRGEAVRVQFNLPVNFTLMQ